MILEVAILDVKPGKAHDFEIAFSDAQKIISAQPGYISHQLQKNIAQNNRFILLVKWQNLEDHTERFRKSEDYQKWKTLLHHFYDPFPVVEHYQLVEYVNPSKIN